MNQSFLGWRKMGKKVRMFCDSNVADAIIKSIESRGTADIGSPDTDGFRTVWHDPSFSEGYASSLVYFCAAEHSVNVEFVS